ncbi:MAG: DUF58 domain-containing protein, partial [Lentisphaeria bacterium]|nr:DUF58 domain-containing protein [Lentisphaeria bacterium]
MNDYYIDEKKFDPELLRQLGRIDIISKVIVDGLKQGGRKSRRKGFSSEFSDYKPYVEGDDLRLLDWRLYARTEKLYVKRFEAETSLEILLLMDATASMAWRWEDSISKLEYSANLMAAIAGIHIQQQDQVGLLVYDADDMHHLPPRARNTQLDLIFSVLAGLKPGAADSFEILVNSLNEMKHHRGRIIICT